MPLAGLKYSSCEDGLLLLATAAHDSSGLFKVHYRPLMPAGFLAKSVFEQEQVSLLYKVVSELTQLLLTELAGTP